MSPPRPGDHTGPHGAGHAKESSIAPDPRSGGSLPLPGAALPPPSPEPARNTVCQPEINASAAPTPAAPTPGPATPGAPTPPNQPRAFLELEEITRTYTLGELRVPVLKGVSLRIERGEYVALMGSSGSGKTTLMNILGCLDRPTSGNYFLLEREVGQASSDARAAIRNGQLGFVFQSFHLLPRTSALDNVQLPFEYARTHPGDAAEREAATRLLERVGLGERLDHEPAQMSGGQQQRVAIARALVHSPPLLLADEPTGNLDSRTGLEILDLFDRLHAEGVTIVLVTHDSEVGARAGRVIRLRDGLVESDTINLQRRQPAATGSSPHSQPAVPGPTDSNSPTRESATSPPLATVTANRLPSPGGQTAGPRHEGGPPPAQAVVPSAWFPLPRGLKTAARAILRNKLRSGLTMLGIVIGVAAVIAMMEIGRGSNDAIQKTIASMGANNLLVQPGAAASGGVTFGGGSGLTLTPRDALELSRQVP
ncbi:MAG: ATP-binding cassette domain-containing protein, partial [Planctomycetaceae bacterium]